MNDNCKKKKGKSDLKSRIIKRQIDEINTLQNNISELEIDCKEKDRIINSINVLRDDLFKTVDELKQKGQEYDKLIAELTKMKNVMNQTVFKGKWKLIRWLLK